MKYTIILLIAISLMAVVVHSKAVPEPPAIDIEAIKKQFEAIKKQIEAAVEQYNTENKAEDEASNSQSGNEADTSVDAENVRDQQAEETKKNDKKNNAGSNNDGDKPTPSNDEPEYPSSAELAEMLEQLIRSDSEQPDDGDE